MTRLSTTFSAWLTAARNFIERNTRFIFLFLVVITPLTAYIMGDLFLFPFLFTFLILVMLALLTIYVARLTREAAKDKRDARAKVGRLWLEFALVFAFGLVVVAIQSDLQKEITVRSDYRNAISQLGSPSPAARMSGIDYLRETCMGEKKEPHPDKCNKDDTITLLIDQVRFFTQSKSYQEDFEEEPFGDIAKIIEILKKGQELSNIVWEGAYLRGADLSGSKLQEADLREANLQEADLYMANLQGARLREANLQRANLDKANLQETDLREANLQGTNLHKTNLQEADLREANLQGTNLHKTNLQEADLREANLQGTNLHKTNLQEADLDEANIQGAYSKYEDPSVDFCTRINSRIGKPTEINKELMDMIPDEFKNTVNTGTLTKETAAAIIKEYNENLTDEQLRCELP